MSEQAIVQFKTTDAYFEEIDSETLNDLFPEGSEIEQFYTDTFFESAKNLSLILTYSGITSQVAIGICSEIFEGIYGVNLVDVLGNNFYLEKSLEVTALVSVLLIGALKVSSNSIRVTDYPEDYKKFANFLIEVDRLGIPIPEFENSINKPLASLGNLIHKTRSQLLENQKKLQFNNNNSTEYLEYTGKRFVYEALKNTAYGFIYLPIIIHVAEVLSNKVLEISLIDNDYSAIFQSIIIFGVMLLVFTQNHENALEIIYGEDYVRFTNFLNENKGSIEEKDITSVKNKFNLFEDLGWLLTKTRL